jgi:hypothetical protein
VDIHPFCCRNSNVFDYVVLPPDAHKDVASYTVHRITVLKPEKFWKPKHIWAQEIRIRNFVLVFNDRLDPEMFIYEGNKEGTRRRGTGLRQLLVAYLLTYLLHGAESFLRS